MKLATVVGVAALGLMSVPGWAGNSEKAVVLTCLAASASAVPAVSCAHEGLLANEIAKCLGHGPCFGPNNEWRKLERSIKRKLKHIFH